jgi:hypothetical protein
MRSCSVEGCTNKWAAREYCENHYRKFLHNGDIPVIKHDEKHGLCDHYLYKIWSNIKDRCSNPKNNKYHIYGGKGVSIFEPWSTSFLTFYTYIIETLGERPSGASLDRINGAGNYEPGNVRWATITQQNINKTHRPQSSGARGVEYRNGRYMAYIKTYKIKKHLGCFDTLEEASAVYEKERSKRNKEVFGK